MEGRAPSDDPAASVRKFCPGAYTPAFAGAGSGTRLDARDDAAVDLPACRGIAEFRDSGGPCRLAVDPTSAASS